MASLPPIDPPPPGTSCPSCGHAMVISDYCGECEERQVARGLVRELRELDEWRDD